MLIWAVYADLDENVDPGDPKPPERLRCDPGAPDDLDGKKNRNIWSDAGVTLE